MKKKNGTILLIDDNEVELKLNTIAMSEAKLHHEIVAFSKPIVALEYILANSTDIFLIICDLKMPLMSGMDLLKKINIDHELRMQAIPFLFLTNSKLPDDVEAAYSTGAQGYFLKPFEINMLSVMFKDIVSYWHNAQMPRD